MADQRLQGEQQTYKIEKEGRELMIEAGLKFYQDIKTEFEKEGAWDADLFFEDARVKALPKEVQQELKTRIEKMEKPEEVKKPEPVKPIEKLPIKIVGVPKLEERLVKKETPAQRARRAKAEKKRLEKEKQKKVRRFPLTPEEETREEDDDVEKVEVSFEELEGEAREALSKYRVEEWLRAAGVHPEKSRAEIVPPAIERLSAIFDALQKQVPKMTREQSDYYLNQGGLDTTFEQEFDVKDIYELFDWLNTVSEASLSPQLEVERQKWIDYLEKLLRDLEVLEGFRVADRESLRQKIKQRLDYLEGKAGKRGGKTARQVKRPKPEKRDLSATLTEADIVQELQSAGLVVAMPFERAKNEEIFTEERPVKEVLQDLDQKTKKFKAQVQEIEKSIASATFQDCERMLGNLPVETSEIAILSRQYEQINYGKIRDLAEKVEQFTPSTKLSEDVIDYWKDYLFSIVEAVKEVRHQVDGEIDRLTRLTEARREALLKEEEEKWWREKGKDGAVSWEIKNIENLAQKRLKSNQKMAEEQGRQWQEPPVGVLAMRKFWQAVNEAESLFYTRTAKGGDEEKLKDDLTRWSEKWKGVVDHFLAKLDKPFTKEEIKAALNLIKSEREQTGETAKHEFLDYLEALRRVSIARSMGGFARAAARLAREGRREADLRASFEMDGEQKEKEISREEWQWRCEFWILGHIFNAKKGPLKGLQKEARALLQDRTEARLPHLRELFLKVVQEKGVCVPGVGFAESKAEGRKQAVSWDHIVYRMPGEERDRHVYGFIRGIWQKGSPLIIDQYSPVTREIENEGLSIPETQLRRVEYVQAKSLDGRAAVELLRMAGVQVYDRIWSEIPGSKQNLYYVTPGEVDSRAALAVNTGAVHGIGFTGAERELTQARLNRVGPPPQGSPEALFLEFQKLAKEGQPIPEDFFAKIPVRQLVMRLDHHSPWSSKESAGVKYLYECLRNLGFFEKMKPEDRKALERAIQFVVYDDNKSHPHYLGKWWREPRESKKSGWLKDGQRTVLGMSRFMTLDTLMKVYKKYGEGINTDIRSLSEADLQEFGLKAYSERQAELIKNAESALARYIEEGYMLQGTKYGPVMIFPVEMTEAGTLHSKLLPEGINIIAAKLGVGGLMYYNHLSGELFFSTTGQPLDPISRRARERLGQIENLRGTMLIGKGVQARLRDVAYWLLQGKDQISAKSEGALSRYVDPENPQGERAQRSRFAPERIAVERDPRALYEKLPHLYGVPVPLELTKKGLVIVQRFWRGELAFPIREERVYINVAEELKDQIDRNRRYYLVPTHMEDDPIEGRRIVIADLHGECDDWIGARDLERAMQEAVAQKLGIPKEEIRKQVRPSMWVSQFCAAWERYLKLKE